MSEEASSRRKRFWGPRRWHRYLGAVLALPLLWLCVTGLLLQHQEGLGLSARSVNSGWLLRQYDQIPEGEPRQVVAGRFTVAEWGGTLFLDEKVLRESGGLVGAVAKPAELVVATGDELLVYDAQGIYLDRLGEASLPAIPIERIGLDQSGQVVVQAADGAHVLSADFLDHAAAGSGLQVAWSEVSAAGESTRALEKALAEGAGFTWARVITDLHSGSLFGRVGKFLVDLCGIGVIVLTLFGIRLLFKRT